MDYRTSHVIIGGGSNAAIGTSEVDVVSITELELLKNTQLTIYINPALGTHSSIDFRFYYRNEKTGTWHVIPKQNISTNEIEPYAARVVSGSPDPFVLEFGLGSTFGLRITAQGTGGADGGAVIKVLARDN